MTEEENATEAAIEAAKELERLVRIDAPASADVIAALISFQQVWIDRCNELRAALAKSQPVEQPVAWTKREEMEDCIKKSLSFNAWPKKYDCDTPLFTHPVRPMSEDQISAGYNEKPMPLMLTAYEIWVMAVRWAEEQLDIKGVL